MKFSTQTLIIVLGIMAVTFLVVRFKNRKGRSRSLRAELVSIDTSRVSAVEITTKDDTLTLNTSANGWTVVANGFERPAKEMSWRTCWLH